MVTLLFAVAVIVVTRFIDPNDYRDQISTLVQDKTGRELQLQGDLRFSVFPWLGIEVESLRLSQPPEIGFDQPPMLQVAEAQLRVRILPLLQKQVEVDTVIFKQPKLHFITINDNLNSFTGLIQESENDQPLATEQQSQPEKAALALFVKGVEITGAEIILHNQQEDSKTQISQVDLFVGDLLSGDYVSLESEGVVIGVAAGDVNVAVPKEDGVSNKKSDAELPMAFQLSSLIQLDVLSSAVSLKDTNVTIEQGAQSGQLLIQAVLIDAKQTSFRQLAFTLDGVSLNDEAIKIAGELTKADYGVDSSTLVLTDLTMKGQLYQREFLLALPALTGNLQKETISLDKLILDSDDLHVLAADLNIEGLMSAPAVSGHLDVAPFNLQQLLVDMQMPYETASSSVLQSVSVSAAVKADADSVSLQKIQAKVDASELSGQLQVTDFDTPSTIFDLSLDQINVDDYLPIDATQQLTNEPVDAEPSADSLIIPMTAFKQLHANGTLKVDDLIASGINLKNIKVNITSDADRVSITPSAALYDGSMTGEVLFTEQDDGAAKLTINSAIKLVNLQSLLRDADITQQLSGLGEFQLELEVDEVNGKQSSHGTMKLSAKDGVIKGADIQKILTTGVQAYNQLRGRAVQEGETEAANETRFAELKGTFNFTDFAIDNQDFVLKAPAFRISGEGDIDIATQSLDYLLSIAVVNSFKGQGGEDLTDLKGLTLPIRFTGSIFAPNYSLDMKALYQAMAERKVNEKKDRYLQRKIGVENASELSSKEILRQALLREIEKDDDSENEQQSNAHASSAPGQANEGGEDSLATSDMELNVQAESAADDDSGDQELDWEDQLKKQLLEELFR